MARRVYLAGPMKGLTHGQAVSWRSEAISELEKYGIVGVSPMRAKDYGALDNVLTGPFEGALTCDRGIVARDFWDVTQNCNLVLANLLGATEISVGTMFEYAWADMANKPIVTVIESEGNPHDHPMVRETTSFRVNTLEEGLYLARAILLP